MMGRVRMMAKKGWMAGALLRFFFCHLPSLVEKRALSREPGEARRIESISSSGIWWGHPRTAEEPTLADVRQKTYPRGKEDGIGVDWPRNGFSAPAGMDAMAHGPSLPFPFSPLMFVVFVCVFAAAEFVRHHFL